MYFVHECYLHEDVALLPRARARGHVTYDLARAREPLLRLADLPLRLGALLPGPGRGRLPVRPGGAIRPIVKGQRAPVEPQGPAGDGVEQGAVVRHEEAHAPETRPWSMCFFCI